MTGPQLEALQKHFPSGCVIVHCDRRDEQIEVFCLGMKTSKKLEKLFDDVKKVADQRFAGCRMTDGNS